MICLTPFGRGELFPKSTLSSRINAARYAVGDTGADQMLIKTIPRKGFRFIGEVEERNKSLPQASAGAAEVVAGKLRQEILILYRVRRSAHRLRRRR